MEWECAANHLPDWMDGLSIEISALISQPDYDLSNAILERYNELCEREESPKEDGHSLYGVVNEKEDLINELIAIYEKYRAEAIKLKEKLDATT